MKQRATKQHIRSTQSPSQSRWWFALVVLAVVAGVLAWVYWMPDDPQHFYTSALQVVDTDPAAAESLAQRAVVASGGSYPQAQLLWCVALARQDRWGEAAQCFSRIQQPTECDRSMLLRLSRAAIEREQFQLAKDSLYAAQPPSREHLAVLPALVPQLYRLQQFDEVLQLCDLWRSINASDSRPLEAAADVYRQRSELPLAAAKYQEALELDLPLSAQERIHAELASVLIELGQVAQAREQLDWLLQHGPLDDRLALKHANLLRIERRLQEASDQVESLLSKNARDPGALMLRGVIRMDQMQLEQARQDFEQVVAIEPYNKEAHYKLGQTLLRLGKPDEAQRHLQTSKRLTEAALEILNSVSRVDPESIDAEKRARLVELYKEIGRPDLAEAWAQPN